MVVDTTPSLVNSYVSHVFELWYGARRLEEKGPAVARVEMTGRQAPWNGSITPKIARALQDYLREPALWPEDFAEIEHFPFDQPRSPGRLLAT